MDIIRKMALFSLLTFSFTSANAVIVGNKDWMQVSDTYQSSWNDLDAIFDTETGQCDVASCILNRNEPGDHYQSLIDVSGYIWASNIEVNELFMHYAGESGLSSLNTTNEKQLADGSLFDFFNDFRFTYSDADGGQSLVRIKGWTRNYSEAELGTMGDMFWASQFYSNNIYGTTPTAMLYLDTQTNTVCIYSDCRSMWPGAWLYKVVVSEPSALSLIIFALIGLYGLRIHIEK